MGQLLRTQVINPISPHLNKNKVMNTYNKIFFFFLLVVGLCTACDPYEEDDIDIGLLPEAPTFTLSVSPENPNVIVITNTSEGFYDFIWDIPGGIGLAGVPSVSLLDRDSVSYGSMGTYDITLHAAKSGGSGTSFSTQSVTIADDIIIECNEKFDVLTDACTVRCWKLGSNEGAVKVGPAELSGEWYSSPEDGLLAEQADDTWCFSFDGLGWSYANNGATLSPCIGGGAPISDYPVPTGQSFNVLPESGSFADYKIVLGDGIWMGVEDSGPEYQIVEISDNEMILLTTLTPCDGSASPGWFTLTFVPAE